MKTTKCNRTVCNNPHNNMKHSQNGMLYCMKCARKINELNPLPGGKSLIVKSDEKP